MHKQSGGDGQTWSCMAWPLLSAVRAAWVDTSGTVNRLMHDRKCTPWKRPAINEQIDPVCLDIAKKNAMQGEPMTGEIDLWACIFQADRHMSAYCLSTHYLIPHHREKLGKVRGRGAWTSPTDTKKRGTLDHGSPKDIEDVGLYHCSVAVVGLPRAQCLPCLPRVFCRRIPTDYLMILGSPGAANEQTYKPGGRS